MFDIAPSELMVVALVAIIFIGPKDLPKAMRFVGQWVGKGRTMARHFRSAMDEMIREAEMAEMEQKWKAENERIMREHADLLASVKAPVAALPGAQPAPASEGASEAPPPVPDAGAPAAPAGEAGTDAPHPSPMSSPEQPAHPVPETAAQTPRQD